MMTEKTTDTTEFKDALEWMNRQVEIRNIEQPADEIETIRRALRIADRLANPTEGMKQYADLMLGTGCNGITVFHGVVEHMIGEIDNADGDGV
ncbi:hypothetical protein [Dyadobacter sp. CY323]|uniref:hypothetical protein n=1 Tax=Dyadobacter sp. CY323 TaxID=2907302 RepID=UPI001F3DB1A5|nr:hypothetical protein [Dyadobacter sp. CY323]MCE6993111.1 hypothetical protein [Dyadobacter sp. CY323]